MNTRTKIAWVVVAIVGTGFLLPQSNTLPVANATSADWHPESFWYEPWGSSGVHKGIDIFGQRGDSIVSSSPGLVLYRGEIKKGGKVVIVLGAKWRIHYYAHLDSINDLVSPWVVAGEPLGGLGDTGNAKGKPPHLHYSIVSLVPLPWRIDSSTQGYKKAFYLNPHDYFHSGGSD